jgi:hypothetical protein
MLMYREGLLDFDETPLSFTLPPENAKVELTNVIKMLEALVELLFGEETPEQDEVVQQTVGKLPDSVQ